MSVPDVCNTISALETITRWSFLILIRRITVRFLYQPLLQGREFCSPRVNIANFRYRIRICFRFRWIMYFYDVIVFIIFYCSTFSSVSLFSIFCSSVLKPNLNESKICVVSAFFFSRNLALQVEQENLDDLTKSKCSTLHILLVQPCMYFMYFMFRWESMVTNNKYIQVNRLV